MEAWVTDFSETRASHKRSWDLIIGLFSVLILKEFAKELN